MRSRRQAREAALQALYQCDALNIWTKASIDVFFEHFLTADTENELEDSAKEFSKSLGLGVIQNLEAIDQAIEGASSNWKLARMSVCDRNILRLGAYELLFQPETPKNVVINEAIEVAKRFGADESPNFINGVLDMLARSAEKTEKAKLVANQ